MVLAPFSDLRFSFHTSVFSTKHLRRKTYGNVLVGSG
jgi:hypothetical protein